MDENTIFQLGSPKPIQPAQPLQPATLAQTPPIAPGQPSLQTPSPLTPKPTLDTADDQGFPFGKWIKAGILVFIVLIILFVMVRLLIPMLAGKKNDKVTIQYWGLWEDKNSIQSIINDFQKENPNISVDYKLEVIKDYKDRLTTRIPNGDGPDVFRFHNSWVPQMVSYLAPIPKDVIAFDDLKKDFYPVVQTDLIRNGAIYGVPIGIDTLSLFVNPEILQGVGAQVPVTWDDFIHVACATTVVSLDGKIKTAGAALGTYDNITHASDIISLLMVQNGVNMRNISENPQNVSDALNFYTAFAKPGSNVCDKNDITSVWDSTLDPSILAFAKGNLALYLGYSWDIFAINGMNPKLSFEVHEVPRLYNRNSTIASYWVEGVSVKSKHQKEALLFLKYLSQKITAQKLFTESSKTRAFGELYARSSLSDTLKSNSLIYPFVQQAPAAASTYFASDTYDNGLNSQLNAYLKNAVLSMLGNTSPQSAVNTLSSGFTQVMTKYGQL